MVREFTGTDTGAPPWFRWTVWRPFWFWGGPVFWPCHWRGWLLIFGGITAIVLCHSFAEELLGIGPAPVEAVLIGLCFLVGYLHSEAA